MKKRILPVLLFVLFAALAQANTVDAVWDDWYGEWDSTDTEYVMAADSLSTDPAMTDPVANAYLFTVDLYGDDYDVMPGIWDEYQGRSNVVELTGDDQLYFELDNYPGGACKELWLTVTYYYNGGLAEVVPVEPAATCVTWMWEDDYIDGWITETFLVSYVPNPEWEALSISFSGYPAYIDSVAIYTECIPEPATIGMLVLGSTLAGIRRRK